MVERTPTYLTHSSCHAVETDLVRVMEELNNISRSPAVNADLFWLKHSEAGAVL